MTSSLFLLLGAGFVLLIVGAEFLVRGASRLALRVGMSPLVIGLTLVAFGTSAPELAVSVQAGFAGQSSLAVGNIVGSNIFNVLVVLGLSAMITPLVVQHQLVRVEVPLLCAVSLVFWVLASDGLIGRLDGVLLTAGVAAYTVFAVRLGRRDNAAGTVDGRTSGPVLVQGLLIVSGLGLLVLGAEWLVEGATGVARALQVSDAVIGLTIVAAGTSLPEVATSIVAAVRGERDIAVGNAIGSCLFNLLAVAGLAAAVAPDGLVVPDVVARFDLPVMLAVAVASLPVFATGHSIARWEGGLFVASYSAYVAYLVMAATAHETLPVYSAVMAGFVVPLTVLTLVVMWVRTTGWRSFVSPPARLRG